MAMEASSSFFEGALNIIKTNCKIVAVCSSHLPTIGNTTYANVVHTGSSTGLCFCKTTKMASSDWLVQASTPAGKAVVMTLSSNTQNMQVVNNPSQGGAAVGIAKNIVMATTVSIQYITTCTTVSLTTSDQCTVPSFRLCIKNPTSS